MGSKCDLCTILSTSTLYYMQYRVIKTNNMTALGHENSRIDINSSGVGVTKPIFSIPSFSQFFRIIKTLVTCMISHSYLKHDLRYLTYTFDQSKFPVMEKLMNRALVSPTVSNVTVCALSARASIQPHLVCSTSLMASDYEAQDIHKMLCK